MADPTSAAVSPLPAHYPRTATHLLLARGGNPFQQTSWALAAAHRTVGELITFLPAEQHNLRTRFTALASMLSTCAQLASTWSISADFLGRVHRNPPPPWGESQVLDGAPAGTEPPPAEHQKEPVYGFQMALRAAESYLRSATQAATATAFRGHSHDNLHTLFLAGTMTHAASAVTHLAAVFTAAVWDFERPSMPPLPASQGRIELRAGPRTIPQSRWSRYARVMFLADRVELTTAAGHEVLGGEHPVAFLMHVVPAAPTSAVLRADPSERYTQVPLYDELGVVHFCAGSGHSLGAIAVADWLAQPQVSAEQGQATGAAPQNLHQHGRLIWALQVSGITAGAAVLGVPIRRGVTHPPSQVAQRPPSARDQDPRPAARVVRPGPHLQPQRGLSARRPSAVRRRLKKRLVVGPASPLQPALQYAAMGAIPFAGLGLTLINRPGWLIQLAVVISLLAVLEPWAVFCWEWLRDRDWRTMVAIYRPGGSPGASRRFAQRAALLFDGTSIGVRGPGGHEAWVAGPADQDLGVTQLHRLIEYGQTWGFALADRLGHWRLVLPAALWAPRGDLSALAGFAQTAGLTVGDLPARAVPLGADPFDDVDGLPRSRGPQARAMLALAVVAAVSLVLTLFSSAAAGTFLLLVIGLSLGPVLVRAVVHRWFTRRLPGGQGQEQTQPRAAAHLPI